MPDNKKQHYVPKFYFKLFSGGDGQIGIYNIDRKQTFIGPIRTTAYEDNFYGKELEKTFTQLEQKQAEIINKIVTTQNFSGLTDEDYYVYLLSFITLQHSRTKTAREEAEKRVENFSEHIIKPTMLADKELKEKGINEEILKRYKITYPGIHAFTMQVKLNSMVLISDLRPTLLVNKTPTDFIFSDHPVIFHNDYFNKIKHLGVKGLANPGLQIFCPLCNNVYLILYDPMYYEVDGESTEVINIDRDEDVDELNKLQYYNCKENIFFKKQTEPEYVKNIHGNLGQIAKQEIKYDINKESPNVDGTVKEIHHTYATNIDYTPSLSFLKTKKMKIKSIKLYRNKELIELHRELLKKNTTSI